jgi:WXXGXW repeat (2 copies)
MKTNIVDHGKAKAAPGNGETTMRRKWAVLGLLFVVVMIGASGCADYYGPAPYYGGSGAVVVAVGDRPYYTRGPGYYVGRTYYVWRPGHWRWVNGQRVWIRGRYVVRG